jgi:predicted nuclease with TOPRIM domain
MTVTQHQRLIEEARQGQRVLAHEVEQLKDEVCRLQDDLDEMTADRNGCAHQLEQLKNDTWKYEQELQAQLANKVVLPERKKITKLMMGFEVREAEVHNACLDEFQRLNGAKP